MVDVMLIPKQYPEATFCYNGTLYIIRDLLVYEDRYVRGRHVGACMASATHFQVDISELRW